MQITFSFSRISICSTIESIKHNSNQQFASFWCSTGAGTCLLIGQVCKDVMGFYCEQGQMNE